MFFWKKLRRRKKLCTKLVVCIRAAVLIVSPKKQ